MIENYDEWFDEHYDIRYHDNNWQIIKKDGNNITVLALEEDYSSAQATLAYFRHVKKENPSFSLDLDFKKRETINLEKKESSVKKNNKPLIIKEKKFLNISSEDDDSFEIEMFDEEQADDGCIHTHFAKEVTEDDEIKTFKATLYWKELLVSFKEVFEIFKKHFVIVSKKDILELTIIDDRDSETIYKYNSEKVLKDFLNKCINVCNPRIIIEERNNEISKKIKKYIVKENKKTERFILDYQNFLARRKEKNKMNMKIVDSNNKKNKNKILPTANVNLVRNNFYKEKGK